MTGRSPEFQRSLRWGLGVTVGKLTFQLLVLSCLLPVTAYCWLVVFLDRGHLSAYRKNDPPVEKKKKEVSRSPSRADIYTVPDQTRYSRRNSYSQHGGSTGNLSRASSQRLVRPESMPTQMSMLSGQTGSSGPLKLSEHLLTGQQSRPASMASGDLSRQSSFHRLESCPSDYDNKHGLGRKHVHEREDGPEDIDDHLCRSVSRQDSLPRYPDQLPLLDPHPPPLVPPLDLRGSNRRRSPTAQQQQQLRQPQLLHQKQLEGMSTRAFSKDPHYVERGRRNPGYAPDLTGSSPGSCHYPRIQDSLALARVRLETAMAYGDPDEAAAAGDLAETDFAGGRGTAAAWRPDAGGGGGRGVQGLQELLRQSGGPRPRDSIEIYRDKEHYLQIPRDYAREFSEDTIKDISSLSTDLSTMTSASGYHCRYGYSSYI